MVAAAGGLLDGAGWRTLLRLHWAGGGRGILRRLGPQLADYLRADFHPWQLDDSALIAGPAPAPPSTATVAAGSGAAKDAAAMPRKK